MRRFLRVRKGHSRCPSAFATGNFQQVAEKGPPATASANWLIMKNGDTVIGIFHGIFETNMLTFNPGWDSNAQRLATFTDVRELQRQLRAHGVQLLQETDESTSGPASFIALDPDGNPILVDQHV